MACPKTQDLRPAVLPIGGGESGNPGYSVLDSPEEYVSNWFAIESLPDLLNLHSVPQFVTFDELKSLPFPFRKVGSLVVCFASADDVNRHLKNGGRVLDSWQGRTTSFFEWYG